MVRFIFRVCRAVFGQAVDEAMARVLWWLQVTRWATSLVLVGLLALGLFSIGAAVRQVADGGMQALWSQVVGTPLPR
jgi:hypothetical protein